MERPLALSSRHLWHRSTARNLVWLLCIFLAMCHLKLNAASVWQETDYQRLERDLLTNYSPTVRPVLDIRATTNLSLTFLSHSICEMDEVAQALTQNSVIILKWKDELLQWDPEKYGGVTLTELSSAQVWLPYVEVINIVSGSRLISSDATPRVVVNATGHVMWIIQDVWKTVCRMDVTYFPFDTQRCNFSIFLWTSGKSLVVFSSAYALTEDMVFVDNAEWMLLSLDATITECPFDKETYSGVTVSFHVQRRRMFHTLTLILPNVLLALLASLVFVLPAESGEKMSFIMGLLLATGVNMTVLMNIMPRSSLDISLLMIYLTALSMTTALSVVASACILSCSSLDGTVGPNTALVITSLCKLTGHKRQLREKKGRNSRQELFEVACHKKNATKEKTFEEKHKAGTVGGLPGTGKVNCYGREITHQEVSGPDVILWKDAVAALDRVCFRISVGVVVGMTFILVSVLLLGSS